MCWDGSLEGELAIRPKAILLSSFAINPDIPSRTLVGWRFLEATAEVALQQGLTVLVVTTERSAQAISENISDARWASAVETYAVPVRPALRFFRWHRPRFTRVEHELWVRAPTDRGSAG